MMMHEWMNITNVNAMHRRNKIKLIQEMIEWIKHEMHKRSNYKYSIQTIYLRVEIITNMHSTKIINEGWNDHIPILTIYGLMA